MIFEIWYLKYDIWNMIFEISYMKYHIFTAQCTALYCTVVYCTVLNWTVLYWTELYCLKCTGAYLEWSCSKLYFKFHIWNIIFEISHPALLSAVCCWKYHIFIIPTYPPPPALPLNLAVQAHGIPWIGCGKNMAAILDICTKVKHSYFLPLNHYLEQS